MYNQNRFATSENALAPTFLTHTRWDAGVPETVGDNGYAARGELHLPRYLVYRLYRRTDGVLIYVGSTGRWGPRMSDHEREQWWWRQVGDMKVQYCASEREALVVEDIAIKREKPLYNKRVNFAEGRRPSRRTRTRTWWARRWCS